MVTLNTIICILSAKVRHASVCHAFIDSNGFLFQYLQIDVKNVCV